MSLVLHMPLQAITQCQQVLQADAVTICHTICYGAVPYYACNGRTGVNSSKLARQHGQVNASGGPTAEAGGAIG